MLPRIISAFFSLAREFFVTCVPFFQFYLMLSPFRIQIEIFHVLRQTRSKYISSHVRSVMFNSLKNQIKTFLSAQILCSRSENIWGRWESGSHWTWSMWSGVFARWRWKNLMIGELYKSFLLWVLTCELFMGSIFNKIHMFKKWGRVPLSGVTFQVYTNIYKFIRICTNF